MVSLFGSSFANNLDLDGTRVYAVVTRSFAASPLISSWYEPGQWIPECQLIVQWTREDQKPVQLMHKVDLIGAKAPYNFIQLTLNPVIEGTIMKLTM